MRQLISRFCSDRCGATSIEYAIIAGGLSIVIITAVYGVGTSVKAFFLQASDAVAQR
ncbi:Flp family type IVb pilin [Bradyrhizobium sp. USDA 10063]